MNQKRLFQEALQLPSEARAALAGELIQSLEGEELAADVEAEWALEIRRRLAEVDEGQVKTIPWAEARRRIMAATDGDSSP